MLNHPSKTDNELLTLLCKSDRDAFTVIYERYNKMLYVLTYRYIQSREASEDIVQQVFFKLWCNREELDICHNLRNYLYTMTKNYLLNYIRNETKALEKNYEIFQDNLNYEDNLVEQLEKKEMMDIFYKAIDLLPKQKKEICLLKIQEGLSNQEIAEKMNLSINTIKTHYAESLKKLRSHLSKVLIFVITVILFAS